MLKSLHIKDYALIEIIEVEFGKGLNIITGETGAGKSILIDALGLVLGDRADGNVIRHGCERAEISAGFALRVSLYCRRKRRPAKRSRRGRACDSAIATARGDDVRGRPSRLWTDVAAGLSASVGRGE